MAAPVESQRDAVMREAFALQALADARFDQQIDRALLEQARADALLDVFSAARFEDDGFDSLQVEQMARAAVPPGPLPQFRFACAKFVLLRASV